MEGGRAHREKRKIVIGVTGASGAPYARRLLTWLAEHARDADDLELAAIVSGTARKVWEIECGGAPEETGVRVYDSSWGFDAPFASGSAGWHAMAIVPCSMGTVGRLAQGASESLLTRAADVMLKERRTLIVVPREAPLSTIQLSNLLTLAQAGALILPASPSFYGKPVTLEDAVGTVVARVLDHLGLENDLAHRWGTSPIAPPVRV